MEVLGGEPHSIMRTETSRVVKINERDISYKFVDYSEIRSVYSFSHVYHQHVLKFRPYNTHHCESVTLDSTKKKGLPHIRCISMIIFIYIFTKSNK